MNDNADYSCSFLVFHIFSPNIKKKGLPESKERPLKNTFHYPRGQQLPSFQDVVKKFIEV
jgi:hypothetical protein